jgi:hypothetical protein
VRSGKESPLGLLSGRGACTPPTRGRVRYREAFAACMAIHRRSSFDGVGLSGQAGGQ